MSHSQLSSTQYLNVIFISIDSLRSDVIQPDVTPNLYSLASRGCLLDTTIVQTPYTTASHASMLTGLYPFNHGVRSLYGHKIGNHIQSVFHFLKRRGYLVRILQDVSIIGEALGLEDDVKINTGDTSRRSFKRMLKAAGARPFVFFLHYYGLHTPYHAVIPATEWRDAIYNMEIYLRDRVHQSLFRLHPRNGYWRRRVNKVRKQLISGRVDQVRDGYLNAAKHMDRWLGQILSIIDGTSTSQDTILVITSDHGESFNEHGEAQLAPGGYEHGLFLYENVVRVPTIFVGPNVPVRKRYSQQVESVDIVPTLYSLLGFEAQSDPGFLELDGRQLHPEWLAAVPWKPLSYCETFLNGCSSKMIRTATHKLIVNRSNGKSQLFNLALDPNETTNLKERSPIVNSVLSDILERFERWNKLHDGEPSPIAAPVEEQLRSRLRALGYSL